MGQDWIKVEKVTARKPEVLRIASSLNIHPDHAFGLCVRFWSWCDDQMSECHTKGVTCVTLDLVLGHTGFATELVRAGWLVETDDGIEIPNFDYHLSESAKTRAKAVIRKRTSRAKSDTCHTKSVTKVRPEKSERREENISVSVCGKSEVIIPEKMLSPEVQQRASLWFSHLNVKAPDKVPVPNSPQLQAFWEDASRLGPERFCAAVLHSTSRGFVNLREPDERRQGAAGGKTEFKNGKKLQEL